LIQGKAYLHREWHAFVLSSFCRISGVDGWPGDEPLDSQGTGRELIGTACSSRARRGCHRRGMCVTVSIRPNFATRENHRQPPTTIPCQPNVSRSAGNPLSQPDGSATLTRILRETFVDAGRPPSWLIGPRELERATVDGRATDPVVECRRRQRSSASAPAGPAFELSLTRVRQPQWCGQQTNFLRKEPAGPTFSVSRSDLSVRPAQRYVAALTERPVAAPLRRGGRVRVPLIGRSE
jgi:hypothetical protein